MRPYCAASCKSSLGFDRARASATIAGFAVRGGRRAIPCAKTRFEQLRTHPTTDLPENILH
eukprot:3745111-Lingulodinium_polyedra.AAC.1